MDQEGLDATALTLDTPGAFLYRVSGSKPAPLGGAVTSEKGRRIPCED